MTFKTKSLFKSAVAAAFLSMSLFVTSCNKDKDVAPLELNQTQATTTFTVIGQWWSPSNAANWPAIYVDLSGSGAQSLDEDDPHQIVLRNHVNGNIYAGNGYELRYIDKNYNSVQAADYNTTAAKPVTTLGRDIPGTQVGWYTYNTTTHGNEPVEGRTVLVRHTTSEKIYAVKLNGFTNVGQRTGAAGLEVKADINLEFKVLN